MPIVLKSGSLNFLEPSGPVQAWNGIALTFIGIFPALFKAQPKGLCVIQIKFGFQSIKL